MGSLAAAELFPTHHMVELEEFMGGGSPPTTGEQWDRLVDISQERGREQKILRYWVCLLRGAYKSLS